MTGRSSTIPARDLIFYQADLSGNLLTRQRMRVIQAILEQKKVTVVTSTGGCLDYLLPLRVLKNHIITLKNDSPLDLEQLAVKLTDMGYERLRPGGRPPASSRFGAGSWMWFSLTEEVPLEDRALGR